MMCFGILVMFCQVPTPVVVDSFCALYEKVVQAKGDGSITGTSNAKRRILANELKYQQFCGKTNGN